MAPTFAEANIMIAVKMAEKIGITALHGPVSKCVDRDRKTIENFIEWTGPLIGLFAAG